VLSHGQKCILNNSAIRRSPNVTHKLFLLIRIYIALSHFSSVFAKKRPDVLFNYYIYVP